MLEPNTIASIVAAIAASAASVTAFIALKPAHRAAEAAEGQTRIQRDLMHQAAQPYVWIDIQPDMQQGQLLYIVLGNSGPTAAHNVRVTVDPPLPSYPNFPERSEAAQVRLREGVLSLAPGRTIRWTIGLAADFFANADDRTIYKLTVTAEGPYGLVQTYETHIRPSDWRESRSTPDGSLHHLRLELKALTKAVEGLKSR